MDNTNKYMKLKTNLKLKNIHIIKSLHLYTSLAPLNRGSPVCISTNIQPRLQISIAISYGIPNSTSGER